MDAVALALLKESDLNILIPLIGDRVKFNANLSMWKTDNQAVSFCFYYFLYNTGLTLEKNSYQLLLKICNVLRHQTSSNFIQE